MRKVFVSIFSLLMIVSCKDFNPVTDSSVRTISFLVDPREAFDSILVEVEDSVLMLSPKVLPEGYTLRTEVLCYGADGMLERRSMCVQDSIVPFVIPLTHIDTAKQHSVVFVTDIVKKLGDDMYQYTWPTFDPNALSTLYIMHVSSFEKTTPWLNSLAYFEWNGYPTTMPNRVVLESVSCCVKLNLVNGNHYDKIKMDIGQPTSMWLHPLKSRRRVWEDLRELLPDGERCQIAFLCPHKNSVVSLNVITTRVNTIDTTSLQIEPYNHPFVITYDCDTKQYEKSEL